MAECQLRIYPFGPSWPEVVHWARIQWTLASVKWHFVELVALAVAFSASFSRSFSYFYYMKLYEKGGIIRVRTNGLINDFSVNFFVV